MRGYIGKRRRVWSVSIYQGRDANGKQLRVWKSFKDKKSAELYLAQSIQTVQTGGSIPTTKLTVGEFLDQWLASYVPGKEPTTRASYEDTCRLHLTPALGATRLTKLGAARIQKFLADQSEKGLSLSPTSVRYHFAILREALEFAVRWGLLVKNPCAGVKPPKRTKPEMHAWDQEQVRLFLGEARKSSRYHPLYLCALTTGMRAGELLGLQWDDINFATRKITVQRTFYRLGRKQLLKSPKTPNARRTIPMTDTLMAELQRIQEEQRRTKAEMGDLNEDHGLVFCQPNGKPLHLHNVTQRDFRKVIKTAKVPLLRFHDLRHTFATLALQSGMNVKVLSEILDHANSGFTLNVYAHVLTGAKDQAIQQLETLFA